jgi:hypothetical protein
MAAGVLAGLGVGSTRAAHTPADPRIEFHRQTRRLDVDTPSVLVARADLPDGGFVMVHDKPASGGHHADAPGVDGTRENEIDGRTGDENGGRGGSDGEDHSDHDHTHDAFGITAYLDPGHYGGVTVPLTEVPAPGTYELVAMLHRDGNGNEEFDGHGTDEHYRTEGSDLHVDADVRFISSAGRTR